jgi:hypothetical protein
LFGLLFDILCSFIILTLLSYVFFIAIREDKGLHITKAY